MNTDHLMLQDDLSRQKIVTEISSNFFVEAGAGSGKTTILVNRMVAMVEQGVDVSKICAITFTKAAAGEFYERFQRALILRSTAPTEENFRPVPGKLGNPTDQTRKRCLAALNDIDLCFTGTIDAFCNMILSEHPAKARIPSDATVLSEKEMAEQYKKAYSDIQKGAYGTSLQQLCRRFCAFHSDPNKLFSIAIGKLMETRHCQHVFDPIPDCDIDTLLQTEKAQFISMLQTLLAHPELHNPAKKESRAALETLQQKQKLLFSSPWQDNISQVLFVLKIISDYRLIPETDLSVLGPSAGMFQPHFNKSKLSWYEFSEDGLPWLVKKLEALRFSATMEFLTAAIPQIADALRKEGKLTFFDYLLYLRDMLREDAAAGGALIRHIYDRHSYFLIDEFQDTSPLQAEIFFYLTAQHPQKDWRSCIPRPGSLFIVGDPKQSIYRFRHADVSAFLRIKEMFTEPLGQVVNLTRNFRSTRKIRGWFNSTFRRLLPDNTPLQSRYEPIPLEAPPESDGTLDGVYSYEVQTGQKAAEADKDPAQVAKIIRRLVGNPACKIQQKDDKAPRPVTYKDIMVITSKKGRMGKYIQALGSQGIPVRVEGKVLLNDCPALVAISRIFAAVANPGSLQALFGALTCKRFGFDLNALHRLKNQGFRFRLYGTFPENEPVSDALTQLKQLVHRAHRLSASGLFTEILQELQLFRYVSTKNLEYVYYVLELLRSAENSGQFASLAQASVYLEQLTSGDTKTERSISLTRDEDRVHIANLHKVKGLEAPIVILADPVKASTDPDIRVQQQDPKPLCWLFSIKDGFTPLLSCSSFPEAEDLETACLEAEVQRLLYVAATRAQRVLIVSNALDSKGESVSNNIWKYFVDLCEGDFFQCIPAGTPSTAQSGKPVPAADLYDSAENLLPGNTSAESSYTLLRPSQIKLKGKTSGEDDFEDVEENTARTRTVRTDAAVIGTLVHSLMEVLVSSRNRVSLPALVEELISEYEAEGPLYRQLLMQVGTTMQNGGFPQQLETPQDILATLLAADEVYCEVPFCRNLGKDLWHGIMDVVYRVGRQWFILDYKTNADAHALDVKYQAQLTAYVEAFRELTGHTAAAQIYHIDV